MCIRDREKTQREYYLNEQMKAIQKELGDDEGRDELADLEEKITKTKLSKEAREKAQHELKKMCIRDRFPRCACCASCSIVYPGPARC